MRDGPERPLFFLSLLDETLQSQLMKSAPRARPCLRTKALVSTILNYLLVCGGRRFALTRIWREGLDQEQLLCAQIVA